MAFRLKLVPSDTKIDFFRWAFLTFGFSTFLAIVSVILIFTMGLNFGIDFRGGTTLRTESHQPVDVGAYRQAVEPLIEGDVLVTEVFDPSFAADQHVAMIRIQAQEGAESASPETIAAAEAALRAISPDLQILSVESVGPKVSNELIWQAIIAVALGCVGIAAYVWLRFEWQFAVGTLVSLIHDVLITVGVFALFQIKFDLTIIAALLTLLGYSVNDTVVIFDRVRENLMKYKTMPLRDLLNLTANETLSRTVMTGGTTLLSLAAMLIFGGDVIRGFVFAMFFGVIIGTYSSVYVAKNFVLWLGVKRDWSAPSKEGGPAGAAGGKFASVDEYVAKRFGSKE